jgi:hypothetical protein
MGIICKIIDKLWKVIEPFIDKVKIFMLKAVVGIMVPIAVILAKVLFIVATIIAISVGLYLAYKWIKEKLSAFVNYFSSGQLFTDVKDGLSNAWESVKNIGKIVWDACIKAIKYVFVDMWVELGKWVWKKLCDFGKWLYDTYIYPWIVEPIEKVKKWLNEKITAIMENPFV